MANIGRKATKCTTFLPATKNWLTNTLSPIYLLTLICIGTHCDTSTTCHFRHMMSLICTLQRSSHNDLDGCQRDTHFGPLVLHSWAHWQTISFFHVVRGWSAHYAGPQYCSFEMQIEKHEMQISLKAIVCFTIHYRSARFHFLYLLRTPQSSHFHNTCCTLLEFAELWK